MKKLLMKYVRFLGLGSLSKDGITDEEIALRLMMSLFCDSIQ